MTQVDYKKILIIDDDADVRNAVKLALSDQEMFQLQIEEATNVDEGLQIARSITPDLVVIDLHMPNKSGLDYMDEVNDEEQFRDTQYIMLTVDNSMDRVLQAEKVGINAYNFIGKPFDVTELQGVALGILLNSKKSSSG